jgi:N-acylglucosamine 2-epimerase
MNTPTMDFQKLAAKYREALLGDVIPFWERHSLDREFGGYFTCLDRKGAVYDTDKFVWLQARQVWTFSMLHNCLEGRPAWLEAARLGAQFLARHGRDAKGEWRFSLARDGRPLTQAHSLFSDCFAAIGFGQFARAAKGVSFGPESAESIALQAYRGILAREKNPKGPFSKAEPGARPIVSLALPMILANVTLELEGLLDAGTFEATLDRCIGQIFGLFLDPAMQVLREHVAPDGAPVDSFEGRVINAGHGIEAMWFMMDIAERRKDAALARRAVDVALRTLEYGWDRELGGIFYFLDAKGHPPQQLEWDQKLWWVHLETLVALLKGYRMTGSPACLEWFGRVHSYAWKHFPDPEFGEWYGYLNRRGEVLLPLKGGKWKGCFHVPRALYLCMRELEALAALAPGRGA